MAHQPAAEAHPLDEHAPLAAIPAAQETAVAEWSPPNEWTDGWRELVLDLVDPDRKLAPFEAAYFFARAKKLALDPLARQIFPIRVQGRIEPFVGIHGIRMLAERTGERAGEKITERGYNGTELFSITVEVRREKRGGRLQSYTFTARMDEFKPSDVKPNSSWATKPEMMLVKCAAANAYRMAFPEVLGGLATVEESESRSVDVGDAEPTEMEGGA